MLLIGSHVSFTNKDQLVGSVEEAHSYGSTTFMFYTGAPQNTNRSKIDTEKTKEAFELMNKYGIDPSKVIVHAPYIINLANNKEPDKYEFSKRFLKEELSRCHLLNMHYLVLHPGSHVGLGEDIAIENIISALNEILKNSYDVTVLLETMAGKGTEVGKTIDEIKKIIEGVEYKEKIGICLDTCHLNDAGYEISNFSSILDEIDSKIGLNFVKCIHINDSKNPLSSHKDRHENIGFGTIGFDNLINVIYDSRLENIPKILETPYLGSNAPYKEEIEMIKDKKFNSHVFDKIIEK
ncbi:MAG: deoxyribonuclease IV [Bacilli bacterium]|nr:deoxyribonuclease IV [Bacilli bacterium]